MFHLIFPFTQSTSNWCQLLAASAFYTLRSLRRTGACPMRLERFVFAYDRVGAFGSHSSRHRSVRVRVRLTRLAAGSLGQTADTLIGREEGGSPIVLVFHSAAESARKSVGEERARGERQGARDQVRCWLGNRQTRIYSFISVIICLYFGFFFFLLVFFDRGTLALISTCWYLR